MAIKKNSDKVAEKKNGMNIVDNMDGEKNAEKKLNMKVTDNMDGEERANEKLNIEVSDLSKSRIKQLLLLKEEAERKGDADKIKEIESELFQMKS